MRKLVEENLDLSKKNFVIVTGQLFDEMAEKQVEDYESLILEVFFRWETMREKFNIFFLHQRERHLLPEVKKLDEFVVLFLRDVSEEDIKQLMDKVFSKQKCLIYCEGDRDIPETYNFTHQLEFFVIIAKSGEPQEKFIKKN